MIRLPDAVSAFLLQFSLPTSTVTFQCNSIVKVYPRNLKGLGIFDLVYNLNQTSLPYSSWYTIVLIKTQRIYENFQNLLSCALGVGLPKINVLFVC